jgi:hypothetical protein
MPPEEDALYEPLQLLLPDTGMTRQELRLLLRDLELQVALRRLEGKFKNWPCSWVFAHLALVELSANFLN